MIRTVVIPLLASDVDQDRVSEAALPLARTLAEQTGATIRLVSVLDREPETWRSQVLDLEPDEALAPHRAAREAYLADVAARLPAGRVKQEVRVGDVPAQVMAVARAHPDPVIVIATHGRSLLGRLLHGSTTSRIVRAAPCPVLVVRSTMGDPELPAPTFGTVLAPIDRSSIAERALEATLAAFGPAIRCLHLVHVIQPLPRTGATGDDALAVAEWPARLFLEQLAKGAAKWGCRVTWEVRRGRPAEQIKQVAAERGISLIALPTRSRSSVGRLLRGSVTAALLRESRVPLMLIWPEHAVPALQGVPADELVYPPPPSGLRVGDIMTRTATAVREDAPLVEVARTMLAHQIGGVPIVDEGGKLRGLITEADFTGGDALPIAAYQVARRVGSRLSAPQFARMQEAGCTWTAARIMTQPAVIATEDQPVEPVAEQMVTRGVAYIPVVRDGVPVGLVTQRDLLKLLPDLARPDGVPREAYAAPCKDRRATPATVEAPAGISI